MSSPPASSLFDEFPPISDEEWTRKIEADLNRSDPEEVLRWNSIEGISLPGYLRRSDQDDWSHVSNSGTSTPLADADAPPANGWRIRQDLWHSDLDEAHTLAETALQGGVTDLGLLVDPTNSSLFGLPLDTPEDLGEFLRELPLDNATLHLDRGAGAALLFSALRLLNETEAVYDDHCGSVGYDPVGALIDGSVPNEDIALNLADELVASPSDPSLRSLSLDLRPYHEGGATVVQELAFGLGALTETLSYLLERGKSLAHVLSRLHVQVSVSTSYFLEVAKLRALRLLIPQVVEAFAVEAEESIDFAPTDLFVQAETSRRTETLYAPHVNMLRGTTEAMAAVLGGCDVLNVRSFDACFRPPSSFSTRIARNVQLILKHEAHFDAVADPAAGSYYVEAATDQIAKRAWKQFQALEAEGGMLDGLRNGTIQAEITRVGEQRQQEVDDRERVLVGTNHYPDPQEQRLGDSQLNNRTCNNGNKESVEQFMPSLGALQEALDEERPMPALAKAIAYGTSSIKSLPRPRLANHVEELRLRTERYASVEGNTPTVLLAPLGPAGPRSARATFARNVFGVAGFKIVSPLMFESVSEAAEEASDMHPDVVVLCSTNEEYSQLAPALKTALSSRGLSPLLVIAGNPDDLDDSLAVDDFIHRNMPLSEKLTSIQKRLGLPM